MTVYVAVKVQDCLVFATGGRSISSLAKELRIRLMNTGDGLNKVPEPTSGYLVIGPKPWTDQEHTEIDAAVAKAFAD